MNRSLKRLIIAALLTFCVPSIFAQATRTYIKSTGSDSNTATFCSDPLNPCRHFQNAHDNTVAGGAIVVLDTGFYGPLSINRAISVLANEGVIAGIVASAGGNGVTVNPGPADVVHLSNLVILSGGNANTTGIIIQGGLRTVVEYTKIQGCKYGIRASTDTRVQLDHVNIYDFTDGLGGGIGVWSNGTSTNTGASTMRWFIESTHITGGDLGLLVDGGAFLMQGSNGGGVSNIISFTTHVFNVNANAYSNCTAIVNINAYNGQSVGNGAANVNGGTICQSP